MPYCEMYLYSPMLIGRLLSSVRSVSEKRKSLQPERKLNAATVARPGSESGNRILRYVPQGVQPSIDAASSKSRGKSRKNGRKTRIANGNVRLVTARLTANNEFTSPKCENMTYRGTASIIPGNICNISNTSKRMLFPRRGK